MGDTVFDKKLSSKKKRDIIYSSLSWNFKKKTHFSGASPPEIFVGRYNYPYVNAGIMSPEIFENTEEMSLPEVWHEKKFSIHDVLVRRSQLIHGKFSASIKNPRKEKNFIHLLQELSMAHKSVSTELFLKKSPAALFETHRLSPLMANPAPLQFARLQENPAVLPKVDYLVGDVDAKAVDSLRELHTHQVPVSHIIKLLSAGLLGKQTARKLVPTRWSITAVDDTLSKNLLKKIRFYPELNEILLFHATYNGNHYEILLLPGSYSFEVLEAEVKFAAPQFWHDYEFFNGRKSYADEVVGAYYANRLAVCEYLERIKKQATAIFFREIRPEYYAPLGVGILRECSRGAFNNGGEKCESIDDAFMKISTRLRMAPSLFREKSVLLKNYGQQKKLQEWF